MIVRSSSQFQDKHQQQQQTLQQQTRLQQQTDQYPEEHKSTVVIMSMKSQSQNVGLKSKENSTAIVRKQFTPISDIGSGSFSSASVAGSIQDDNMSDQCGLTQAGLEEYNSRSYYDQAVFHHQKQSSYAQSEGYHSYVSSSDSSSATPFLDRLRQESELLSRQSHHWSQNDLSTSTTTETSITNGSSSAGTVDDEQSNHHLLLHHHHHHHHHHSSGSNPPTSTENSITNGNSHSGSANINNNNNSSSETHSSTETLKWLGSMSDVSEASHATGYSAISGSVSSPQLIVHSSRVLTPKRHHSESVLYMNDDQQLSPVVSISNSPTSMPARISPCSSGASTISSGAIYMSHQPHYIPQTSSSGSLTKCTVAPTTTASTSSPTLLFSNANYSDQLNKSTLSVTISGAASPNDSTIGNGTGITGESQTLHQSLLSLASSSSTSLSSSSPQQQSISISPTLSVTSLSLVVTSSSSSPSASCSGAPATTTAASSSYRSNHRLFPVSTYTEPINGPLSNVASRVYHHFNHQSPQLPSGHIPQQQQPQYQPVKLHSPQPSSWQSVADRINDIERQQQLLHRHKHHQPNVPPKYTYIDPSKTHRVSNPALKVFQKNAVQSYFERQQLQQQQSKETSKYNANGNTLLRPHSFQPTGSPKEVPSASLIRNSLPNNYGVTSTRKLSHHQLSPVGNENATVQFFTENGVSPPPPPPPRSRSLMPVRRSSSASEYAEFREQFHREKLQAQSIRNAAQPEQLSFTNGGLTPPPPPPRGKASMTIRRTSSASEYAAIRDKHLQHTPSAPQQHFQRQNTNPVIMNEWVPERPPKNPGLRIPSPELPPPPPAIISTDTETNLSNQDDPLPPPPPEILRPSPMLLESQKPPSPNRRNSFAGSPSRKSFFTSLPPRPTIPKKPTTADLIHLRPASNLAHPTAKAHKIVLNDKPVVPLPSEHKTVLIARKRPHNPAVIPPILENAGNSYNCCPPNHSKSTDAAMTSPPPPLKPRMPTHAMGQPTTVASKIRCNSKASYLPRQSLEKLNSADPDHGSYKLTLTSNEDCVTHHHNTSNSNSTTTKSDFINGSSKCSNLPDVLPAGAKLQPSSPTTTNSAPLRYGSNSSISPATPTTPNYQPPPYPNMKMFISKTQHPSSRHSSPAASYTSPIISNGANNFNRSQSYDASSTKHMSQSTIDLMKTQIIESPEEATNCQSDAPILSPAQSENNINSYTPRKDFKEFHRSEVVRKLSLEERDPGEGRIVRAELVNTTLSTEHKVTRKDSLRENIEKITQLQSKLMSAHISENGERKILGYPVVTKPQLQITTTKVEKETVEAEPTKVEQTDRSSSPPPPPLPSTPQPSDLHIISQMEPATDGLKLMQRTEIILRVNPVTNEVASQTDDVLETDVTRLKLSDSRDEALQRTTLQPRQKHPIETDCEKMIKELATLLPQNDRLRDILLPKSNRSAAEYLGKLYNPDVPLRPIKRDVGTSTLGEINGEAKFELQYAEVEVSLTNGASDGSCDFLMKKKEDLIKQLTRKLNVLNTEQATIADEASINDELGSTLAVKVADKLRPIDATKFRTYIDDVGHITSLLLSLSGRLARVENSLNALTDHSVERKSLIIKRDRLAEQLEEAKRLKEDIDRRGSSVTALLERNLSTEDFADYDYFINMKAKLIADARDIADKIKSDEEQLSALNDALIQSDC